MLTVVVGLEASGASSTRRPLDSRYSEMPSTEATSDRPAGALAAPAWKARNDVISKAFRRADKPESERRMAGIHVTDECRWSVYGPDGSDLNRFPSRVYDVLDLCRT